MGSNVGGVAVKEHNIVTDQPGGDLVHFHPLDKARFIFSPNIAHLWTSPTHSIFLPSIIYSRYLESRRVLLHVWRPVRRNLRTY